MSKVKISKKERSYLRELAKKQLEYSKLPIMKERTKHWYANNGLKSEKPIVVIEHGPFREELFPVQFCKSEAAIAIEKEILTQTINYEMINDDKVVPDYFPIYRKINMKELDQDRVVHRAKDTKGRELGYSYEHPIIDLKRDFKKLKKSVYSYDDEGTKEYYLFVQDLLGDILDVKIANNTLLWFMSFTARAVNIMGLERIPFLIIRKKRLNFLILYLRTPLSI